MIIHNDFVCFNYFNNQFHHFASWALWYAARFVSVITLKVLILRDEIGFLFIRNFHIFKVLRPIYLLLCSLLTTFWILSIQIVGFYLQFSLDSFFLTALYVNAALWWHCYDCKSLECTSNDNSPVHRTYQYKILYPKSHFIYLLEYNSNSSYPLNMALYPLTLVK